MMYRYYITNNRIFRIFSFLLLPRSGIQTIDGADLDDRGFYDVLPYSSSLSLDLLGDEDDDLSGALLIGAGDKRSFPPSLVGK